MVYDKSSIGAYTLLFIKVVYVWRFLFFTTFGYLSHYPVPITYGNIIWKEFSGIVIYYFVIAPSNAADVSSIPIVDDNDSLLDIYCRR